ncbi:hypothetical protein SynWH8101_1424 [Synechococcus sp. WH 8101]|nr:hypothetical protein SynWH8101_1424 [Synechococcus sp. WH 8101]QNI45240.1 hypothetical protein SynRCC2555_01457 [Synechococcus sp. WH 8101]
MKGVTSYPFLLESDLRWENQNGQETSQLAMSWFSWFCVLLL